VWSSDVLAGDAIYGWMWMSSGNYASGTEVWQIEVVDDNTGDYALLTETLSGFNPFNSTYFGTLEVHGLTACAGLPDSYGEWFYMGGLYQASNSGSPPGFVGVTSEQGWNGYTVSGGSPSCSWNTSTAYTPTEGWLGWTP
jgi:hypothetical protein